MKWQPVAWQRVLKTVWALPCSVVGLLLAVVPLALGGESKRVEGAWEVTYRQSRSQCRARANRFPFRGIVFGQVILAITDEELQKIRRHERVHVAQYERWGLLFFLAYPLSSLWQLIRGRRAYWDNHFEVEARRHSSS
jgi:hypothetical protein